MSESEIRPDSNSIVVMATVGKTHGVRGLNRLNTHTERVDALQQYETIFIRLPKKDWQPVDLTDWQLHSKKLLVRINQSADPEQANRWVGSTIGVLKSDLPALSEGFYFHQLEGLTVINTHDKVLGKLTHIWSNGAHDVFEVKGEKTHTLPYIDHVIKQVDLQKQTLIVDWDHDH